MEEVLSQKAFDLMPPYPQPTKYHHHESKAKKLKKKSQKTFLFFFFGLFFICALYILTKLEGFNQITPNSAATTPAPTTNNTSTSGTKFELFNDQGNSNLTTAQNTTKVRIFNGATNTNNLNTANDMLLRAGYEIEKSDKADSNYGQSIIYYKNGQVTLAQKAADALKPTFNAQLQESTSLDNNYDLLIIIGAK